MTATTHQMVALISALWVLTLFPVQVGPLLGFIAIVAVMIGALTPDLDQPTANIWRKLLGGNHLGNIFRFFSGGHRHLTHSLIGIFLIGWLLRLAISNFVHPDYLSSAIILWRAFMVGYISHPLADTFTDWGVPWLWPVKWHLKIPPGPGEVRVTTDSFVERLFVRGAIIIIAVLLIQSRWLTLKGFFII